MDAENLDTFGIDPVYLKGSTIYDAGAKPAKDGYQNSDLNAYGFPFGFVAARPSNVDAADAAAADDDGGENATAPITPFDPTFPVLFSNNLDSAGAQKLAAYLREGYFLDKLTSEVRVTIIIFSPYIKTFTVLNGELGASCLLVFETRFPLLKNTLTPQLTPTHPTTPTHISTSPPSQSTLKRTIPARALR